MSSPAVQALRCPVCQGTLRLLDSRPLTLACQAGHRFDAAKQGYFNLLTGKGTVFEADSPGMVEARRRFLDGGHYAPLSSALAGHVAGRLSRPGAVVLDAGTGTGNYLHAVLDRVPSASAVGLDISKYALRRAARTNPQAVNLVWDIWRPLPLADHSVDVVMVVFAPRNPEEFVRVLRPGGTLVVVTPRPGHLAGVAAQAGLLAIEEGKADRLRASLDPYFEPGDDQELDVRLTLTGPDLADLAFMGPAGHHLSPAAVAELAGLEGVFSPTAKFRISTFVPRPAAS
ncbi:methyltransferase domain-containing protein [Paenarthrobacter sp. NyZ202]|uniref:methyltransferase domain-containing protein n=1 Tax=Paenarthrobacter sp. NyZ202 TaxID=3402689 RepID=UPI003CF1F7B5